MVCEDSFVGALQWAQSILAKASQHIYLCLDSHTEPDALSSLMDLQPSSALIFAGRLCSGGVKTDAIHAHDALRAGVGPRGCFSDEKS
jgi:hypothetical protein